MFNFGLAGCESDVLKASAAMVLLLFFWILDFGGEERAAKSS